MEVMAAAAEREAAGDDVIHLEVGQPATSAPRGALEAAAHALTNDRLGYTGAAGLPALRERIARWYDDKYSLEVEAERVVVTTGASGAFVLTFLAYLDPGDRVGILEPGYPCYRNDLLAFGAEPVAIPVGAEQGYRPSLGQLEAALPLKALVLASPSNPTGTVLADNDLASIVAWARDHDVQLIADEIYHGLTYDQPAPTILAHTRDAAVVNSFSKYFSMTGWRLGWTVTTVEMAEVLERLAQSLTISAPTISQFAALGAFDCEDELQANVTRYAMNRAVLLEGFAQIGLTSLAPADGAFYIWADVSHLTSDSKELSRRWLSEIGVAVTPGVDFDPVQGHRFVRFSYAGDIADMQRAIERLGTWRP